MTQTLLLAGLYFLTGKISFSLLVSYHIVTLVIFTAEGLALAAVILLGQRLWLGVFLGQLLLALYNGLIWYLSLGIAVINSAEAIIGAIAFQRLALKPSFNSMRDLLGLLSLIFFVLQPFSATLGNGLLWLGGVIPVDQLGYAWLSWWFGNALGQALITPLLLAFFSSKQSIRQRLDKVSWLSLLLVPIGLLIVLPVTFSHLTIAFTITIPVLILIAAKGGIVMVNLAAIILSIVGLLVTQQEMSTHLAVNDMSLMLDFNAHLLAVILTGQFVAVLLAEFRQVQLAQIKTTENLQSIASQLPNMVYQFRLNPDGSSCFPSVQGIETIYRLNPEQVQKSAESVFAMIHPDDYELVVSSIQLSAQQLTPWQCDYRVRFDNGEIRWLSGHSMPELEQDGSVLWHGFIRDVTDIKHKEIEYQTIIEASSSGFFSNDFSGRLLTVNQALAKMLGYSKQELLTMRIADFETVETHQDIIEHIQRIVSVGGDKFESIYRCKNGTLINVEINALCLAELGQRFFVFINDITERKRMEKQLRDSEQNFRRLIENAPVCMAFIHNDGRIGFVNNCFTSLLGYSQQDIPTLEDWWQQAYPDNDYRQQIVHIWKTETQQGQSIDTVERNIVCKNGTVKVALISSIGFSDGWLATLIDITERKQMEAELRKNRDELQHYFDQPFIGMLTARADKQTMHVNQRFCEIVGYSQEEMRTIDWAKITHPDDLATNQAYLEQAIRGEINNYQMEKRYIHKHGHWVYIDLAVNCIRNDQGQIEYFIGMMLDITERKQMEAELRKNRDELQHFFDQPFIGMITSGADKKTIRVNQRFCDIFGYNKDEMLSTDWAKLTYPDDLSVNQDYFEQALRGEIDAYQMEKRYVHKNGQLIHAHLAVKCVRNEQHQAEYFIGMVMDITERKQMEERLHLLSTALNQSPTSVLIVNLQEEIEYVNTYFCQVTGYTEQEVLGKNPAVLLDSALTPSNTRPEMWQTLLQGQTWTGEFISQRKNGEIFYEEAHIAPVKNTQGQINCYIAVKLDITERKRVEAALQEHQFLLKTAQQAARMGHYVTNISTGTWTNDAMFDEIFGIDKTFIRDITHWQHIIHSDDIQRVTDYFHAAAQRKEKYPKIEYRIIRPNDGLIYWVAAWGHNFYDEQGQAIQQVGMIQDITERKLREQQLKETSEQLQLVLEGGHLGFWDWNIITGEVERNAIWAEMLGYSYDEIQHTPQQWEDFIYIEDRKKAWQSIYDTLEGKTPYHEMEYRMWHKDGSLRWILDHASIVQRDNDGKPTRMSGTHTDITKLKRLEEQLRESEDFFQSLAQINPVGIYRTDSQGQCIFINHKGCEILGMTSEQTLGTGWMAAIIKEDRKKVYTEWQKAMQEKRQFQLEYRFQHADGKIVWVYGLATVIHDKTGQLSGYVGTITDITERKEAEEYINHLAFYDPLTHLPNRRLLRERLKHGIELNHRTGSQMAVLMLDLDKFKPVNDNLGHAAGDELLQQSAMRIKDRLRETDMVARLGGDEFVVLIENIEHCEQVAYIADAIIHALNQPFTIAQNHQVYISTSIGIAIHPNHGKSIEELLDNADAALYHAKEQGRACFAYFSEILTQQARERITLENRLRHAIEHQQLHVYFQPQIDIMTGDLIGAEALIRWHDPLHGMIPPSDFILLAEETGLIITIGEWVLKETCKIGKTWLDKGLPALTLAVNVSPYQFRRHDINVLITRILTETQFPARYLELEITETGLMENQEHAMSILNRLRNQGVRLAIDDFGTGYSSLAYLKYFPLDVLKIDKTFISNLPYSQDDVAITSTIIAMAHHLGFKVLAEGVETEEHLTFLQQHGCDMYQGYLYSVPLSASEFESLLQQYQNSRI